MCVQWMEFVGLTNVFSTVESDARKVIFTFMEFNVPALKC